MAYCGTDDLKKIVDETMLVRLADDSGTAASIDDALLVPVIAEATEQADSEIDIYLAKRYSLPLDRVPLIISDLSARMTVYYLSLRTERETDEKWDALYKRSVKVLEQMAAGIVSLGIPGIKADSSERPKPCMVGIDSTFSRKKAF